MGSGPLGRGPLAGGQAAQDVNGLPVHVDALKLGIKVAQRVGGATPAEAFGVDVVGHGFSLHEVAGRVEETIKRCKLWAAAEMEQRSVELQAHAGDLRKQIGG